MKRLTRFIASRITGFVLVAVLVFCAVMLVRNWLPPSVGSPPPAASALTAVDHPTLDGMEPIVRKHVQAAREKCESLTKAPDTPPRQRGRAWGELGKVYFTYDFAGPAAACLQNAQALDADEFRWSYFLAHARERAGHIDAAVPAMARAVKAMAADATATPQDEVAALCFLGDMAMRLNRPEEARRTFEAALSIRPECPFALVKVGQLASDAGDSDTAIERYRRALEILPGRPAIRALLAVEYRRRGDLAEAARYAMPPGADQRPGAIDYADPLLVSVEELNRSAKRQNQLGQRHAAAGRKQQAARHFALGVQADPENSTVRGNLGITLLALGQTEEAIEHLEEARRKNPQSEEFRAGLIRAYAARPATRQKGIDDALAWREEHPRSLTPLHVLANLYFQIEHYQEALETGSAAARIDAAQPWPVLGQADALAALGRHAEARDRLEQAHKTFPDDGEVRHTLARFLVTCPEAKQRDAIRGLKLSQELVAAETTVIRAETLALALAENGKFDEAVKRQRWAVQACGDQAGPRLRERLEQELKRLEAKQPVRERWPFCEKEPVPIPPG